jgi:hypothetical protein
MKKYKIRAVTTPDNRGALARCYVPPAHHFESVIVIAIKSTIHKIEAHRHMDLTGVVVAECNIGPGGGYAEEAHRAANSREYRFHS